MYMFPLFLALQDLMERPRKRSRVDTVEAGRSCHYMLGQEVQSKIRVPGQDSQPAEDLD